MKSVFQKLNKAIASVLVCALLLGSLLGVASAEEEENYSQYLGYADVSTSEGVVSSWPVDVSGIYADLVTAYKYVAFVHFIQSGKAVYCCVGSDIPLMVASQGHSTGSWDCSSMWVSASENVAYFICFENNDVVPTSLETPKFLDGSSAGSNYAFLNGYYYNYAYGALYA